MVAAEGQGGFNGYYKDWDKYAGEVVAGHDKEEEEQRQRERDAAMHANLAQGSRSQGYEFRTGHKTQFPPIIELPDETDQEAAWRVAGECRAKGNKAFAESDSVVCAHAAVDFWGQGLLCLERLKNLRKYAKKPAAMNPEVLQSEEFWKGWADETTSYEQAVTPVVTGPAPEVTSALMVTLRLNIAQALLKLHDFEACICFCDAALELEPHNSKALWRKAKAVWATRNPGLAREALTLLLKVDGSNAAARQLLREIEAEEERLRSRRLGQRVGPARSGLLPTRGPSASWSAKAAAGKPDGTGPVDAAHPPPSPRAQPEPWDGDLEELPRTPFLFRWCCRRKAKAA